MSRTSRAVVSVAAGRGDEVVEDGRRRAGVVGHDPELAEPGAPRGADPLLADQDLGVERGVGLALDDVAARGAAPELVGRPEGDQPAAGDERDGVARLRLGRRTGW